MTDPIPCNCWLMDVERQHDEPACPSPCVFDDPSEEVDNCSHAIMLRDAGNSKTDCAHYRATASAAELTDKQLLKLAAAALDYVSITPPGGHLPGAYEAYASELLTYARAAIAADRELRPQPTAEALQAAYVEWFKANQGIPPSPTAARTAAAFTLAVLRGEVEV